MIANENLLEILQSKLVTEYMHLRQYMLTYVGTIRYMLYLHACYTGTLHHNQCCYGVYYYHLKLNCLNHREMLDKQSLPINIAV